MSGIMMQLLGSGAAGALTLSKSATFSSSSSVVVNDIQEDVYDVQWLWIPRIDVFLSPSFNRL